MSPLPAILRLLGAWIAGIVVFEGCRIAEVDAGVVSVIGWGVAGLFVFVGMTMESSACWTRQVHSAEWKGGALLCVVFSLACLKAQTDLPECRQEIERGRFQVEIVSEGVQKPRSVAYHVEDRASQLRYMLYWGGEDSFRVGNVLTLDGVQFPLSDSVAYHRYLYRQGYSGTMYARQVVAFSDDASASLLSRVRRRASEVRQWCLHQMDSHEPTVEVRSLIRGCLLGDKRNFDTEVLENFSYAGMSHLLAVSGLHIGILFAILWFLLAPLRWLGCRGVVRVLSLLLLWAYVAMIGFPTSAVRAAVMFSMIHVAAMLRRDAFGWHILGASAFFLLLYDTQWLWNLSFQMSFLAVAAILAIRPELEAINRWRLAGQGSRVGVITRRLRWRRLGVGCCAWIGSALLISLAAQWGTLPLSLHYFHHLPCLGFVQAVAVLPLMSVYLFSLILLLLFHALSEMLPSGGMEMMSTLSDLCWSLVDLLSQWILAVAEWAHHADIRLFGDVKWFPDTWEMIGFYAIEISLLFCWRTKRAIGLIVALAVVALLLGYNIVLS